MIERYLATFSRLPRTPSRAVVLLVTGLPAFLVSLNLLVMAVAFPALQTSFPHSSRADLSWVLNAHNIVFGALLIPGGRAADRWGRRRIFGVGLLVFTAGSLACGLAPTVPWLIAGRILQGAGSALVAPASLGLLLAAFPVAQRATAVTIWGGIASLGPLWVPPWAPRSWSLRSGAGSSSSTSRSRSRPPP